MTFYLIKSSAQFYPVQVTPQLVPPYSVYLSDYAASGSEKLRVIIVQRDLTQPVYQLRLVMSVELNGRIIMRTARSFNPRPLNIDPGVPTIISGSDLSPYLDSRNIDFVGYSREQYEKTRALPEGSYRIVFTAYDYHRQDVQVSNEGISYYYLSKNEPPLINFPACGTKIQFREPQQIVFSWLPRNTASPTSAADTEYEFTLFETRPAGRNPNDVVLSTQPIFRTRVDIPQLVYGPAESVLLDGMKYVWRVQAIDKNGKDAFRNNGFSEVCTFTYGGDATFDIGVVKNLQAIGETERRAKISWQASNYDSYKVYYKKTSAKEGEYEWFWSNVKTTELKLFDLEPDTEYETRVQVRKSGAFGPYSEIVKFRTLPVRAADCGQEDQPFAKADESRPLQAATKAMIITVDNMEMTLLETISLGGGWFKGTGTVAPKILGRANFYVKFERLFIDENHVAGRGRIDFVSKGVAELQQQQIINQQKKNEDQKKQENREQWSNTLFQENIFKYDFGIEEIGFENGELIVTASDGNTFSNTEVLAILKDAPEKAIIIEDKNGEQWVVQKDATTGENKVTKVEGGGLVVGSDGKVISEKNLGNLYRNILKALRKYKKSIEEYQASIRQTQPSKGGGPSLSEEEIEMLWAELPTCLVSQKAQLDVLYTNIKTYADSGSTASLEFVKPVSKILAREFSAEADLLNASYEKVEPAVCEALAVGVSHHSFSAESMLLLLAEMKDGNEKKKNTLDISVYANYSGEVQSIKLDDKKLGYLKVRSGILQTPIHNVKRQQLQINPASKNSKDYSVVADTITYKVYKYMHAANGPVIGDSRIDSVDLMIVVKKNEKKILEDYLGIGKPACTSGLCCTKCGKDLTMTEAKFSKIFPRVLLNKKALVDAFNVSLKESGFEYNTCDRQAKILAQIAIETNNLTATTEAEGRTWKIEGKGELLDYFRQTLKAKVRWFNQEFWSTKLYKKFSQAAYFEKIEKRDSIPKSERYKPTDSTDYYGYYNGSIQTQFYVRIPVSFVKDTLGEFRKFADPTFTERAAIKKNIFNYAYGNTLGNGDYLTTDDGFNYRGRGAIQITGKSNYIALNNKLKLPPYNDTINIVDDPDAVAKVPRLIIYSAFIHFKSQLKNSISKLDQLSIEKVSALVNTGNENGNANHSTERTNKYNLLIQGEYKCDKNE